VLALHEHARGQRARRRGLSGTRLRGRPRPPRGFGLMEGLPMRVRTLACTLMLVPIAVPSLAAQATGIREVTASERNLIPLQTKLRYTTMILLPDDEEIVDVVCGDKDWWVISAAQNIAHIKPAKEGAATNLNLVTTSGA